MTQPLHLPTAHHKEDDNDERDDTDGDSDDDNDNDDNTSLIKMMQLCMDIQINQVVIIIHHLHSCANWASSPVLGSNGTSNDNQSCCLHTF